MSCLTSASRRPRTRVEARRQAIVDGRFKPFAHPFGEVWREDLGSITNPILVMWGAEDRVCPVDMAPGITKAFPNADLHVFANCGHWVQWEMHEKFDRMVADFFDN